VLFLFVLAALAAPRVDPGLEPAGVEAAYQGWAASKGRAPAAQELVCRPFAEGVELCFTRRDKAGRVYYTHADGADAATLEAKARGTADEALAHLAAVSVDGFEKPYWLSSEGDGRDHAALLFPDALAKRVGPDLVVAVPVRGALVAWSSGNPEFDKVVGVGVRRMYDTLPDPVSPRLYRWDGAKWVTWGEARPVDAPPTTPPSPPAALPPPGR
jgi:hypothetical protein